MAIDQGTSSCRAIVLDATGVIRGVAQREFTQHFPKPGWVEHDPEEIWTTQAGVMREALCSCGLRRENIAAVGITNQRETTVVWDRRTGDPICKAIVWQDRRTDAICERLNAEGRGPWFHAKTGLVVDPYFSGTKVQWILDHIVGAREAAEAGDLAFGTVDSWLVHRLTGGRLHITDESNASRTLLWNIHTGAWDDEILTLLRIPRAMLPEVRSSSEIFGEIEEPRELRGIPIAGILGDQQAATVGQMCLAPGMAKNTCGTGCFLLLNTGERATDSKSNLLTTVVWSRGGARTYALEGSVFVAGAAVQWLRDGLGIIQSAPEIEPLAASVADTGGLVFVPALAGLGAPHWDPRARGTVVGISRATTRAHLARAALEGIAFEVTDLARAMEADCGAAMSELRVDGGAAANNLLLQIQADLLQFPVVRPTTLETTALGAAYAAGLAAGVWRDVEEIQANWQVDRVFEPLISRDEAEARRETWRRAVERARGWAEREL